MTFVFRQSVEEVIAATLEAMFRVPPPIKPSQWAKENLIVPDGPRKLEPWDAELTPYIAEPLDKLGPDDPANEVAVMKSAQTGFTTLLLAAVGHSIDRDPCDMMVVQPTDGALTDFNSKKLGPCIESTEPLKLKVASQTSRSGKGSTTYTKMFERGSLDLAIANSAADLRSKTIKKAYCDEVDQYPEDLDDQGSPLSMIEARQESFLDSGEWKRLYNSTPTVKGGSEIERRYEAGDQRRWHVPCPHCDGEFVFEFGSSFRYNRAYPYEAHYVAPCCGAIIQGPEKNTIARRGRWVATDPKPGAYPSYHFDALSSPFVPWDKIAQRAVEAGDDPNKLKGFYNLTLGLPYEIKGDAPDHVRLLERREEGLTRGHVPPRGLILVAAADVQMRGLWVEIKAYAHNRERWTVDAFYIDGDTSSPDSDAFEQLKRNVLDREYPDSFGRMRKIDALAVDSGYRSHVVYSWVRNNQRLHPETGQDVILAIKGAEGWGRPSLGQPQLVDIHLDGRKVKQGAKVWAVGTWSLKGAFYSDLRKEGIRSGRERDPDGLCHFGAWLDEVYFRQITSEYLADEKIKGRIVKRWKERGDNHFLDCCIYNDALAEYLGLSTMTPEEWAALARARGMPDELLKVDLFTPTQSAATTQESSGALEQPSAEVEGNEPAGQSWLGDRTQNWMGRR